MKSLGVYLTGAVLAGALTNAHAQDVWAYEVIKPDGGPQVTFQAPRDLSYPPAGERPLVADANADERGILLTPQQEAARQNAPKLIIMLLPFHEAEDIQSAGRF